MERDKIFIYVFIVALVLILPLIFATTTLNNPVADGNYSGTLVFNCTTNLSLPLNATLLYNASGGAATTALVTMVNDTASDTEFYNGSVSISSLSDGIAYNMTCMVDNLSAQEFSAALLANITIDNTPPNVSFSGVTNTVNGGNYTDTILILNVSVNDATIGLESVYFNITYQNGTQLNFTQASNTTGTYYNISLNISGFTDGKYNITVWANDSELNNLNNSETIQVRMDNAPPSMSISKSSSTKSSLTLDVSVSDAVSGPDGSCSVSRGEISGTGASRTITESGLSCSSSYSYTVTCSDSAGNSGPSTETSFSTDSCSSSGTTSGSSSSSFWTNTFVEDDKELSEKGSITKQISEKGRLRVKIDGEQHYIGVIDVTSTTATINISSTPQQTTLGIGDEKKFDVTDDNYYDLLVKLNSVSGNNADITILEINEEITSSVEENTGEDATTTIDELEEDNMNEEGEKQRISNSWLIFISLIIIVVVVWFVISNKSIKIKNFRRQ